MRTLTNSVHGPNPFGNRIQASPFYFDEPNRLDSTLAGTDVLYNTYWVRFNHLEFNHAKAVDNTIKLFSSAKRVGVQRVVHISITNASVNSELEYFRGKGELEQELIELGLSYSILRPAVLFGREDILINNIAWVLRRLPVFGVFGNGQYRLQPIFVDDLAALAVTEGKSREKHIIDAIGPETFTFRELVETIGQIIGKPRPILSVSPGFGYVVASLIGRVMGDVFLTREEITGLMQDLLFTNSSPAGDTRLTEWARRHVETLGRTYASELGRRRSKRSR